MRERIYINKFMGALELSTDNNNIRKKYKKNMK